MPGGVFIGFTHIDHHVGITHEDLRLIHRQFTGQGLGMDHQVMGCFHGNLLSESYRFEEESGCAAINPALAS